MSHDAAAPVPLTAYAFVQALPEWRDAVLASCRSIVDDAQSEEGCLTYHLLGGLDDQNLVAWFERWASEEAFEAHLRGPSALRLGRELEGRLAGPMTLVRLTDLV